MLDNNQQCKIRKWIGLILLVVLLCFYLAACGQVSNSNTSIPQDDKQNNAETIISDDSADESNNERDTSQYGEAIDDEETIFEDYDGNLTILDKNKKILASSVNGDFEAIYAFGDGFYALWKNISNFDYKGTVLWIVDSAGNEILHLDNPEQYSLNDYDKISRGGETVNLSNTSAFFGNNSFDTVNNYYCGAGWVYFFKSASKDDPFEYARKVKADYFNCFSKEWKSIDTYDVNVGIDHIPRLQENPFAYVGSDKRAVSIIDANLNVVYEMDFRDSEDEVYFGKYSDGGFIYNKGTQFFFLDCQSWTSIAICEDSEKILGSAMSYKYLNGKALIALEGADGRQYCAVIDKQGNYVKEPYLGEYSSELEKFEDAEGVDNF